MPNSIIYACGDYVKLKSLRQCNGLRNKNPIALAVGVSMKDLEKCLKNHKSFLESNGLRIRKGLEKLLSAGSVKVLHDEGFWRLKKG